MGILERKKDFKYSVQKITVLENIITEKEKNIQTIQQSLTMIDKTTRLYECLEIQFKKARKDAYGALRIFREDLHYLSNDEKCKNLVRILCRVGKIPIKV